MKKIYTQIVLLFFACLFLSIGVHASEKGFEKRDTTLGVYDDANILTETRLPSKKSQKINKNYKVQAAVHTITDISTLGYNIGDIQAYADDWYDYSGFGEKSGIVLVIDSTNRKYHISTTGKSIDIFESSLDNIAVNVESYLRENNYNLAADTFLYDVSSTLFKRRLSAIGVCLILPLIISGFAVFILVWKTKSAAKLSTQADGYFEKDDVNITTAEDTYRRSTTRTEKIQSNSSSGSSTHKGSSGRKHGGRGGSF